MPIRRIEGATPAPVINVNGKDVTLWNHGTIADGINLTVKTLGPICSAINDGYGDLSAAIDAEKERAIQAETDLSGWCDSLSSKLDTVSSNLDIVSGKLDVEIERSTTKDNDLQEQIDTLKAATDVIMVYNTYSDFSTNSGSLILTDKDVIKVLNDEERQENQTYYQYSTATSSWSFIGELDPYYSKTDLENAAGKNINITTADGIKINTNDDVVFTTVTSTGFSGTNLSGASKHDTIDNLFSSAYSGVAASAYITTHSADFLNFAHSAYGKLTFGTKEYPANNSSYNFTFLAGQGISFTTGNNQVTISAEGTTYSNDDGYISINNATRKIGLATTGIKTSAYSAEFNNSGDIYNSYLNGERLHFDYGQGGLDISFTGVSYYGGGSQGSAKWDNLFQNYAQVNRDKISTTTTTLTADKVNFIVASGSSGAQPYKAVNFVVTSTLPSVLDSGTYYIV